MIPAVLGKFKYGFEKFIQLLLLLLSASSMFFWCNPAKNGIGYRIDSFIVAITIVIAIGYVTLIKSDLSKERRELFNLCVAAGSMSMIMSHSLGRTEWVTSGTLSVHIFLHAFSVLALLVAFL
jgi:hypothetical protein